MRVAVVDGQGGGIGKAIVEKLRSQLPGEIDIIALGTNAMATSLMLKAGANEGASGENAVLWNADRVDVICGAVGIIAANSMAGELSPAMACAIASSSAVKVLLPLNRCGIEIAGVDRNEPLPHLVDELVRIVREKICG